MENVKNIIDYIKNETSIGRKSGIYLSQYKISQNLISILQKETYSLENKLEAQMKRKESALVMLPRYSQKKNFNSSSIQKIKRSLTIKNEENANDNDMNNEIDSIENPMLYKSINRKSKSNSNKKRQVKEKVSSKKNLQIINDIKNSNDSSDYLSTSKNKLIGNEKLTKVNRKYIKFENIYDSISENENEISDIFPNWYSISPFGVIYNTWNVIKRWIICFIMIYNPIMLIYIYNKQEVYNFYPLIVIDVCIDLFCILNVIITLVTGCPISNSEAYYSISKIVKSRLFSLSFYIDFLLCFPFNSLSYIYIYTFTYQYADTMSITKSLLSLNLLDPLDITYSFNYLIRLLCLMYILDWIKLAYIYEGKNKYLSKLLKGENGFSLIIEKFKTYAYIISFLFILIHILSCLFIYIGIYSEIILHTNWIIYDKQYITDKSYIDLYLSSLYYIFLTLLTIGYGDITPISIYEHIFSILLMLVGCFLYSYLLILGTIVFGEKDIKSKIISERQLILTNLSREYDIKSDLFNKLNKYIVTKNYLNWNNSLSEFLDSLPNLIKNNISIKMFRQVIENIQFFNGKSDKFLLLTVPLLKGFTYDKQEIIWSIGEKIREMIFLVNGKISICLGQEYHDLVICDIHKGDNFGEISMFENKNNYNLIVKTEQCKLFTLSKADFLLVRSEFSVEVEEILTKGEEFYNRIEEKTRIAIEYYNKEKSFKGFSNFLYNNGMNSDNNSINSSNNYDVQLKKGSKIDLSNQKIDALFNLIVNLKSSRQVNINTNQENSKSKSKSKSSKKLVSYKGTDSSIDMCRPLKKEEFQKAKAKQVKDNSIYKIDFDEINDEIFLEKNYLIETILTQTNRNYNESINNDKRANAYIIIDENSQNNNEKNRKSILKNTKKTRKHKEMYKKSSKLLFFPYEKQENNRKNSFNSLFQINNLNKKSENSINKYKSKSFKEKGYVNNLYTKKSNQNKYYFEDEFSLLQRNDVEKKEDLNNKDRQGHYHVCCINNKFNASSLSQTNFTFMINALTSKSSYGERMNSFPNKEKDKIRKLYKLDENMVDTPNKSIFKFESYTINEIKREKEDDEDEENEYDKDYKDNKDYKERREGKEGSIYIDKIGNTNKLKGNLFNIKRSETLNKKKKETETDNNNILITEDKYNNLLFNQDNEWMKPYKIEKIKVRNSKKGRKSTLGPSVITIKNKIDQLIEMNKEKNVENLLKDFLIENKKEISELKKVNMKKQTNDTYIDKNRDKRRSILMIKKTMKS